MQLPSHTLEGNIVYDIDYQQQSLEGNPGKADELGIFLPTLVRSASTCGEILELGNLCRLEGWGHGRGFRLTLGSRENHFELLSDVFDGFPSEKSGATAPSHFPLLGEKSQLAGFLADQAGVSWIGFRDSESNRWEQYDMDASFDADTVPKATMMVLQADILLKGHGLPRRRLHLAFQNGALTSWAAANDDYLMLIQTAPEAELSPALSQAGEAFLLGAML